MADSGQRKRGATGHSLSGFPSSQGSSFRHYATGYEGEVEIESEWTARKQERAAGRLCPLILNPTQAKEA
jgi:hypothetical protein